MSKFVQILRADQRGAAAVEFAMAAPIFLVLLFGVMQFGMMFQASNGLQQAVEVGARFATIYPRPTDAAIQAKVLANTYGLDPDLITPPTITHGTRNGMPFVDISMTYDYTINLMLFQPPAIPLTHQRTAFQVP